MVKRPCPKRKRIGRKTPEAKKNQPKLTRQTITRVAKLAKLKLNQRELSKLSKDLETVLKAFERLQEKTSNT